MGQKQFETRIGLTGGVDSSLQKAIGASVSELNKLQNYTRGLNTLLAKSNLAALTKWLPIIKAGTGTPSPPPVPFSLQN